MTCCAPSSGSDWLMIRFMSLVEFISVDVDYFEVFGSSCHDRLRHLFDWMTILRLA